MATFFDDDMIEVISVFKCRFCQFKASDPQEVRNHVTSHHMTVTVKEELGPQTEATGISSLVVSSHPTLSQEVKGIDTDSTEELLLNQNGSHLLKEAGTGIIASSISNDQTATVQVVSSVLNEHQAVGSVCDTVLASGENIVLEHTDIVNESDKVQQISFPSTTLKQDDINNEPYSQAEVNLVEQDMTFASGEMLNLKLDPASQKMVAAGLSADMAGFQMGGLSLNMAQVPTFQNLVTMENNYFTFDTSNGIQANSSSTQTGIQDTGMEDMVTLTDNWSLQPKIVTGTRELFLCGQCNMGFVTMDECKIHIEQNHQLSVPASDHVTATQTEESHSAISGPDFPAANKQSQGVQVTGTGGRRRGRKRKEEVVAETQEVISESSPELEKEQGQLAEEACFEDDFRTDLSSVRRVSSREVKTPRHLLSEYYIGQKKPADYVEDSTVEAEPIPEKRRKKILKKINIDEAEMASLTNNKQSIVVTGSGDSRDEFIANVQEVSNSAVESSATSAEVSAEGSSSEQVEGACEQEMPLQSTELGQDEQGATYVLENSDQTSDAENRTQKEPSPEQSDLATTQEISVYPEEEELLGDKMSGKRNPYGIRLTQKFEIEEELKTPKHKYTIKCKYKSCRGRFLSKETHDIHLKCHRRRPGHNTLVCYLCAQSFSHWAACKYHLWKEHRVDLDLYKCDQCDFRTDMTCKMDLHKVVHREDRPYMCRECGRGFKQPAQLRNHEVLHEQMQELQEQLSPGEAKQWFQKQVCDVCEKEFANNKTLRHHQMVVHGRLRPYQCQHCDHTASTKAALELHNRTHTGEKPFKCDECDYVTGDHNSLRRHRMRHTGEKPYKCPHCSYSCIQSVSIKTHIQYKHADQMSSLYKCQSCDFNTVNQKLYLAHVAEHEKGWIPPKGISRVYRRNYKKPQVTASGSQSKTLFACAQCSYTSDNIATLVGHLITHKKGALPTGTTSVQLIPSSKNRLADNGGKAQSQINLTKTGSNFINAGLSNFEVLPDEIASDVVDNVQVLTPESLQAASGDIFLKQEDCVELLDINQQNPVVSSHEYLENQITFSKSASTEQHTVLQAVSSESEGNQVSYVSIQCSEPSFGLTKREDNQITSVNAQCSEEQQQMEDNQITYVNVQCSEQPADFVEGENHKITSVDAQCSEQPAVPVGGVVGDEMVYTLKEGQTVLEPLQLLDDGEESTFLCMEDGRLQPVSISDLPGSSTFLTDKVLIQDLTGLSVATQSSDSSSQVLVENQILEVEKSHDALIKVKTEEDIERPNLSGVNTEQ